MPLSWAFSPERWPELRYDDNDLRRIEMSDAGAGDDKDTE